MQRRLLIYVVVLGIGAAAFPEGSWAAFDGVNPLTTTAAASVGLDRQSRYLRVEYLLTDRFVAGVRFGAENTDITDAFDALSVAHGITGLGYAAFVMNRHLSIDASVGYTGIVDIYSKHTAAGDPVTESIDGFRVFTAANLNGAYNLDRWGFSGNVGYLRSYNRVDGPRESVGTVVLGSRINLARVRVSGRVTYHLPNLLPFVRAFFVWDHDLTRVVVGAGQTAQSYGDTDSVVGGGFSFRLSERVSGGIGATTTFGPAKFTITTVSGNVRFVF